MSVEVKNIKYINFLFLILSLWGCSLTRGLKHDELLLYNINTEGIEKSDAEALKNLIQQKPNTRIPVFNLSPGVLVYDMGTAFYDSTKLASRLEQKRQEARELSTLINEGNSSGKIEKRYRKLEGSINNLERKLEYGNWFMRTGNAKVILDSTKLASSRQQMTVYLQNNGFFEAKVHTEIDTSGKKAEVSYLIEERAGYRIDSIFTKSDDSQIYNLLEKHKQFSLVKEGDMYTQADLTNERQRIEDLLKDNGYYTFSKSFIEYNVFKDTLEKQVVIEQLIRKTSQGRNHRIYTIDSIVFTIASPNDIIPDEKIRSEFDNVRFIMYQDRYAEKIIRSRIFQKKGDVYSKNAVIETQRQLANLDVFRFVNISFDTLDNRIRTKIFTRPNQKFQITNQLGASVTEQLPGPFFSHSLRNRNLFRGLEIFEFNFRAGLEGVASATTEGGVYRSRELSSSASMIFPQFLVPFNFGTLEKFGRYNPRTRTLLGYSYVNRPEYVRDALNTILAYTWATRNLRHQFSVNLLDANLIRSNLDSLFQSRLEELQAQGNNLINSFLPSYVSSISGQVIINFNQYGLYRKNQASLWRLFVESGGTTFNFLDPERLADRNLNYFQFLKFQSDFRRYIPLTNNSTFAYRLNLGLAKPYGISGGVLPYEKYFFAGGSTSIRAWQPRRLGPGSFTPEIREDGSFDYRFEQPGEILFEAMFEFRRKLFGYFDGAFFIDAGNTWTFAVDPSREGTDFKFNRFYKELAVGTGLGLRMDFDFLVLRLDMGIKAYDPARPEKERFILDKISFKQPFGEKGQQVFNIGIGYPF
ncbi:translocation and assembly module lipoprotein TamL [Cyclobacterium plantarum]|uniref:BamA/TamA family outer membrane protein n=1 Tax=Cyclobacterium plantarum TaxID=2716263 RepID=A0ABX0H5H2_9BACT|nr:BamA/TamA family outer membrane protein [Cyclobacterium plantarum]NHE55697.1 BamA/TamA family outer membrane protein [Cyclobacterium plantarum]